jgi:hypothetical protein
MPSRGWYSSFSTTRKHQPKEGLQVKKKSSKTVERRQEERDKRLDPSWQPETARPVFSGASIAYDISDRVKAVTCGGLGVVIQLVEHLGLAETLNKRLSLLKRHLPYHESDHILNLVYNIITGGHCLTDLEPRRQNPAYLDALGAVRIPAPTTSGDFLCRFTAESVETLMDAINEVRSQVWLSQPAASRKLAVIDVDGTIVETTGECKERADFSYKETFGYAPLVLSLANTQEVIYTVNRSANEPSHSGAVKWMDKSVVLARASGFGGVRLRGDTDFSLTTNFDRWTKDDVEFVFGIDNHRTFVERAESLQDSAWKPLKRKARKKSKPRRKPSNTRKMKVIEREYLNRRLTGEDVAEIPYTPTKASGEYRMIILRKAINVEKGQQLLESKIEYFFYVTNIASRRLKAHQVVFESNSRCHQENLIEQLKNGVHATRMPVRNFVANWAYMVIATLAWNLKAMLALTLPDSPDTQSLLKMEYRRFVNEVITTPAQILHTGRRLVYRLLSLGLWGELLLEGDEWFHRHCRQS